MVGGPAGPRIGVKIGPIPRDEFHPSAVYTELSFERLRAVVHAGRSAWCWSLGVASLRVGDDILEEHAALPTTPFGVRSETATWWDGRTFHLLLT